MSAMQVEPAALAPSRTEVHLDSVLPDESNDPGIGLDQADLSPKLKGEALQTAETVGATQAKIPTFVDKLFQSLGTLPGGSGVAALVSGLSTTAAAVFPKAMAIGEGLSVPKRILIGVAGVALIAIGKYLLDIASGKELAPSQELSPV